MDGKVHDMKLDSEPASRPIKREVSFQRSPDSVGAHSSGNRAFSPRRSLLWLALLCATGVGYTNGETHRITLAGGIGGQR